MVNFFKSCATPVPPTTPAVAPVSPGLVPADIPAPEMQIKCEKVVRGYMDDPSNTDHAWKEVELWHIHYSGPDTLSEKLQPMHVGWRVITEDVFIRLPSGQSALLNEATKKLHPAIF